MGGLPGGRADRDVNPFAGVALVRQNPVPGGIHDGLK
jgi:hypothetical protein